MALDVGEALTRKIGPLPAWAYGAIVLGGVWAVYLWRKQSTDEGSDDDGFADELGIGASVDLSGHLEDTGLDGVTGVGSGTGGEATTPTSKPKTNAQWLEQAVNYLTNSFGYDRNEVVDAVYAYLQGKSLSVSQWAIVNLARAHIGDPPEGTAVPVPSPAPSTPDDDDDDDKPTPKPKPKPDPKKPDPKKPKKDDGRWVTVTKWPSQLSTLWGISEKYLGNGSKWRQIWDDPKNAEVKRKRARPESIRAGDKFWVD